MRIEKSGEQKEKKTGRNTRVRFTFVRHSQKESGRVFQKGVHKISKAGVSGPGRIRSREFGRERLRGRRINKAYATPEDRTKETLEYAFRAAGVNPEILQKSEDTAAFFQLSPKKSSSKFHKEYDAVMQPGVHALMEKDHPGEHYDKLDLDEQERIMEIAEEPAMEHWLQFDDIRPDKNSPSPREVASWVAYKMNRLINLPDFMPDGKEIDLVSSGHKTSTEAFLKYCLAGEKDGEKMTGLASLAEIGGSLKILDSWDLIVENDAEGKKTVKFILKRENEPEQELELDISMVRQLAKEHIKANKLEAADIDL